MWFTGVCECRLAGARALGMMSQAVPDGLMAPYLRDGLVAMVELLSRAVGEPLHTSLDTFILCLEKVDPVVAQQIEPQLTPLLLQAWAKNAGSFEAHQLRIGSNFCVRCPWQVLAR